MPRPRTASGAKTRLVVGLALSLGLVALCPGPGWAAFDTFLESFEAVPLDSSIEGVDLWDVMSGSTTDAVVQSTVVTDGTKSLKLISSTSPVSVARPTDYGSYSPTWVRFYVRPAVGSERQPDPSTGIASVSFDYTGKVLASDGTAWIETGKTYAPDTWWEVIYKLDFSTHTYDVYLTEVGSTTQGFEPAKAGLHFIDPSKNSLTSIQMNGAYNSGENGDTYIDGLLVSYIERIEFSTAAQTVVEEQASQLITVQLQSSLLEPQRAFTDIMLELRSSSGEGTFSLEREPWEPINSVVMPQDANSVSFYYKDSRVGKPVITVSEYPDQGWLDGLQEQQVITPVDHFEVLAGGLQTAGAPFLVTVHARNDAGEPDVGYDGTVLLSVEYVNPMSGAFQLQPVEATGFANGELEVLVTYPDAGTIAIVATDSTDSFKTGTSGEVQVVPSHLLVSADTSQVVGRQFPVTVVAVNTANQPTPNYLGQVTLSPDGVFPTPGGTLAPPAADASAFVNGSATVLMTYPSWGTLAVRATDASHATVTGVSEPIFFHPASFGVALKAPPAPRAFFYTQEPVELEVTPLDHNKTPIANYQGTLTMHGSLSDLGLPASYLFLPADAGKKLFAGMAEDSGHLQFWVEDSGSGLASEPVSFEVKQAYLKVVAASGSVGTVVEVPLLLVDDTGKVIETETGTKLNIRLIEANPNNTISAVNQQVTLTNGRATLLLSNSEAEEVTVIPTARYAKSQHGTVKFGRFATKGVGVLLWREIRTPTPPTAQ